MKSKLNRWNLRFFFPYLSLAIVGIFSHLSFYFTTIYRHSDEFELFKLLHLKIRSN